LEEAINLDSGHVYRDRIRPYVAAWEAFTGESVASGSLRFAETNTRVFANPVSQA